MKKSTRLLKRPARQLRAERLEERGMFAALLGAIVQEALPNQDIFAGQSAIIMWEADIYAFHGNSKLNTLSARAKPGTNFSAIQDFTVWADKLNPGDGIYETPLAQDIRPVGNSVTFVGVNTTVNQKGVALRITADLKPTAAPGQRIGLANVVGTMTTALGRFNLPIPVFTVGAANPMHTVAQPARLLVNEKTLATTDTAVENQDGLVMGAFQVLPQGVSQVVTGVEYAVANGSNGQNWSLRYDGDNNGSYETLVQAGVPSIGNKVVFDNLANGGVTVIKDQLGRFQAQTDAASSFFATTMQATLTKVSAEKLTDGSDITNVQIVNTPQTVWSLRDSGTVVVTLDATPVRSHDVLAGAISEILVRANVRTEYEAAEIYYIGVDVIGEGRSLDKVVVKTVDGVILGNATRGAAMPGDDFGLEIFDRSALIPKGIDFDLLAAAQVRSDNDGADVRDNFSLAVDTILARGDISSNDIAPLFPNGSVQGPVHRVVGIKVADIKNVNPTPSGSGIQTGVTPGLQVEISTADNVNTNNAKNRLLGSGIPAEFDFTNVLVSASGFFLTNKADQSVPSTNYRLERLDGTVLPRTGTVTGLVRVVFYDLENSPVNTEVEANSKQTFVVSWNTLNAKINPALRSSISSVIRPGDIEWLDVDAGTRVRRRGIEHPDSVIRFTTFEG